MESPRKRMRLAVPGTMGLLETRGTPPGQASRRKRPSWTPSASSSSPRTVQTPRRGPGQRRLRAGLCTATTATSVHSTPPWMASRWPGGQGTLGGTAPEAKSYSRESCPLFEIKRKVQAVDGGQVVQGVPRQVHHHVEVDGGQAVQGVPQQVHHHQEGSQRSCHQHRPEQGAGNSAAKHQWTPSPSADPEREIKCLEKSDSFDNVLSGRLEREKEEEDEEMKPRRKNILVVVPTTTPPSSSYSKEEIRKKKIIKKIETYQKEEKLETSPVPPLPASSGRSFAGSCSTSPSGASELPHTPGSRRGRGTGGKGPRVNFEEINIAPVWYKTSCETAPYTCTGLQEKISKFGDGKTTAHISPELTDQWERRGDCNLRRAALLAKRDQCLAVAIPRGDCNQ